MNTPNEPGAYAKLDGGIELWYRDEGNPDGEPMLLIMGLGSQLIAWPEDFVTDLAKRGYRVIRFDNRDCGLSSKIAGSISIPAYWLVDMAEDAAGLLAYLDIDQAHVVGASMGGMIAQLVAIHHAEQVRTLCSIMSTTGNPLVGGASPEAIDAVLKPTPPEREKAIEHIAWVYGVIGSKTLAKEEHPRRVHLAAAAYDRMFYPDGTSRQFAAIVRASNRTADLRNVLVPSLVVHGAEDSLINISGGRATDAALPDSVFLELGAMGHDLPHRLHPQISAAIDANARRAAVTV